MQRKYVSPSELEGFVIKGFSEGRTIKSLAKEFKDFTIFEDGRELPKGYIGQVVFYHLHGRWKA